MPTFSLVCLTHYLYHAGPIRQVGCAEATCLTDSRKAGTIAPMSGQRSGHDAGFFERVFQVVRRVPPGKVVTYGGVARTLGQPHAARTVGWALRGLPAGTDVPWYRVVGAAGKVMLGSEYGGQVQRAQLEAEGVQFDAQGRIDLARFGWEGLAWLAVEMDGLLRLDPMPPDEAQPPASR